MKLAQMSIASGYTMTLLINLNVSQSAATALNRFFYNPVKTPSILQSLHKAVQFL